MLKVDQLIKLSDEKRVLDRIDLDVPKNTIVGIVGPPAAGKTTLFRCLNGFYRPDSGDITLDGVNINDKTPEQILLMGVAFTTTNIHLVESKTALQNIQAGMYPQIKMTVLRSLLELYEDLPLQLVDLIDDALDFATDNIQERVPRSLIDLILDTLLSLESSVPTYFKATAQELALKIVPRFDRLEETTTEDARKLLRIVGLAELGEWPARKLARNERRRLEFARALAANPRLLLLDQPTLNLKDEEALEILRFIRFLKTGMGKTIVLFENDHPRFYDFVDHLVQIEAGRIVWTGKPENKTSR